MGLPYLIGCSKKDIFAFVHEVSKKTKRVEGEVTFSSWEGDFDQISVPI